MAGTNDFLYIDNHAHEGYRRAGVAFKKGVNALSVNNFSDDQLACIAADPHLSVAESETSHLSDSSVGMDTNHVGEAVTEHGLINEVIKKGLEKLREHKSAGRLVLNSDGKPATKLLGVSAAERDVIWAAFQKEVQTRE